MKMNKRQIKKIRKKSILFVCSFVTSWAEYKKYKREYHEWVIQDKRRQRELEETF